MTTYGKKLTISRIYGTSAQDDSTFVFEDGLMAYVAGAGVVVSTIIDEEVHNQRFYCANSGKSMLSNMSSANSYLNMIPGFNNSDSSCKKIDSYGYTISDEPELIYGANSSQTNDSTITKNIGNSNSNSTGSHFKTMDDSSSPSKLSNKIRSISCIAVSPDKKLLAVGESGYQPRVLIYSLAQDSKLKPVFIINDHQFGINKLKFSPDSKRLASLGFINDGYLNIWKLDARQKFTLVAANKCSSVVNLLMWESNIFMTIGVRHIKIWFVDEIDNVEDEIIHKRISLLKGKNVLLNAFLNSNFIDYSLINAKEILILSDQGDLGLLEVSEELKFSKIYQVNPSTNKILVDENHLWLADSEIKTVGLDEIFSNTSDAAKEISKRPASPSRIRKRPMIAMEKFTNNKLVYLTDLEEISIYDYLLETNTLLVSSLIKSLSGCKKCFNGELMVWSKKGLVKKVTSNEVLKYHEVKLPSNELITNDLCTVEVNNENEIFAGDKFGNLIIYHEFQSVQMIKAHDSSITGTRFFEIDGLKFVVSISRDRMIQIFQKVEMEWELFQTLSLHKGTLIDLLYHNKRIFVSSSDRTISVHKFDISDTEKDADLTKEFEDKLKLNEEAKVKIYQEKIISDKSTPIKMEIFNEELVLSNLDKSLTIYKIGDKIVKSRVLKLYNETNDLLLIENFSVLNNLIYISSSDKSLRCFDYHSGKQLSCNWGHSEQILGLIQTEGNNLISVGNDGCMFKWEQEHVGQVVNADEKLLPSVPIVTQKVARKILPSIPLTPTSNRQGSRGSLSSMRSLSPTAKLMTTGNTTIPIHKSPSSPSPSSCLKSVSTTTSVSPSGSPRLRQSTLNRLSQPVRSPLKAVQPRSLNNNKNAMTLVEVCKMCQNVRQSLIDKSFNKPDLQSIRLEMEKIWKLLNEEDEMKMLENYSDKLLQMFELKIESINRINN